MMVGHQMFTDQLARLLVWSDICQVGFWLSLVSCPAELALMRKYRLVKMLAFLGPGSVI